jgi:hypothetical protein
MATARFCVTLDVRPQGFPSDPANAKPSPSLMTRYSVLFIRFIFVSVG